MVTYTALLDQPVKKTPAHVEPLLREALGAALRSFRADRGITLPASRPVIFLSWSVDARRSRQNFLPLFAGRWVRMFLTY